MGLRDPEDELELKRSRTKSEGGEVEETEIQEVIDEVVEESEEIVS